MKRITVLFLLAVIAASMPAYAAKPPKSKKGKKIEIKKNASRQDSIAYAFGVASGANFSQSLKGMPGDSLDMALILKGFTASCLNEGVAIDEGRALSMIQSYYSEIQEKEVLEHKKKNEEFLTENIKKEGWQATESGLQYRMLREGTGARPTVQDSVEVNYRGTTIDGVVFDDSYSRNSSITFPLLQVIPGWTEGICLMNEGAKFEFAIPSKLAYGERGAGGVILPNSTLLFEVELLNVKPYEDTENGAIEEIVITEAN